MTAQVTLYYNEFGEITMKEIATHYRIAKIDTANRSFVGSVQEFTMNGALICEYLTDDLTDVPDSLQTLIETKEQFTTAKYIRKRDYYPDLRGFLKPVPSEHNTYATGVIEEQPEYPDGVSNLITLITGLIRSPERRNIACTNGKVVVEFTIMPDGTMDEYQVTQSLGYGCDREALSVMKLVPDWKPAYQSGHAVRNRMSIPVFF